MLHREPAADTSPGLSGLRPAEPDEVVRIALPKRSLYVPQATPPAPTLDGGPPESFDDAPLVVPPRDDFTDFAEADTEEIAVAAPEVAALDEPQQLDLSYDLDFSDDAEEARPAPLVSGPSPVPELRPLAGGDDHTETMDIPAPDRDRDAAPAAEEDELLGLPPDNTVLADLERLEQMLDEYLSSNESTAGTAGTAGARCGMDEQWWAWFESMDKETANTRFGLSGVWWHWFESMDSAA